MSFDVKGLLTKEYGKNAYAAIQALNPAWTYAEMDDGRLYLHPDIIIKCQGDNGGYPLPGGFGHSADDILVELHQNLLDVTKPKKRWTNIALVNAYSEGYPRAAYCHNGDGRLHLTSE